MIYVIKEDSLVSPFPLKSRPTSRAGGDVKALVKTCVEILRGENLTDFLVIFVKEGVGQGVFGAGQVIIGVASLVEAPLDISVKLCYWKKFFVREKSLCVGVVGNDGDYFNSKLFGVFHCPLHLVGGVALLILWIGVALRLYSILKVKEYGVVAEFCYMIKEGENFFESFLSSS